MELGVTVGTNIDRLEATASGFDFAEFGLAEAADVPERIDEGIVTHQRNLLSWAGSLGARKAVLHGTMRDPHDTDLRPRFASQLAAIRDAGLEAGVEVVVENVGHQKRGLQLSVLGDLARETDTPVCFDIGHAYMEDGNEGIERFLGNHGDLVSHLHAHDARRRGDTHLLPGPVRSTSTTWPSSSRRSTAPLLSRCSQTTSASCKILHAGSPRHWASQTPRQW